MFFAPAAMFAMFFYLSQYIQTVMGFSPIKAGVAFLPFCFGLVAAAGISSNLVNRIDPRYLAGVGTLMAAAALFGFSRLPYDTSFPVTNVQGSYLTDLLPFILLMSFGMGMTFVPLTLTAVHHLRNEDTGIGSGVLNTMQQVGGALGLSLLGTVATQTINNRVDVLQSPPRRPPPPADPRLSAAQQQAAAGRRQPPGVHRGCDRRRSCSRAGLMVIASLVTWIFLNVKHEELATDGPEAVVAVWQLAASAGQRLADRLDEGGEVVGVAAGDQPAVHDDLLVLPRRSGVLEVEGQARVAGQGAALGHPGVDQQPGPVADHGDHLVGVERLADDLLGVLVDAEVVGVDVPPGTTTASIVETSRSPKVPSTSTFWVGDVSPSTAWIGSVSAE